MAYICTDPGIPVFGRKGASVHVQAVLRVLVRRGMDVHLLAARVGGDVPADLDAVQVHPLPEVGKGAPTERERAAQRSDAAVEARLEALGQVDLVYERYALWGRTATAWAERTGTPSVLEVNAPLVDEQAAHRRLTDRPGAEQVARAALSSAGAVICVSEEVADWARGTSARPERVHTVPNGVDVDRVRPSPREPAPAAADPFRVGFVGTLKAWHGVEVLVEALALLAARDHRWRLLLVGDGPRAEALRAQVAAVGIGGLVEFTGSVDPRDVPAHLHRMDVAAAPYPPLRSFYFSPLKVYEYLAAGLPVVASRVGQVPDALDGGRLGVLVEPGNPVQLASALAGLRRDVQLRRRLGLDARAAALDRHSWEGVVDRVLELAGVPAAAAR